MNKIANYDTLDYDYRTYWKNREYENEAEHILLNKIFNEYKGNWFVDIGGSYGRLTNTYYDFFRKPVIIDYSLKTLQKNRDYLLNIYPNLTLIAANAYNLPFRDHSFDGGLMVRVLHHINEPKKYFKEVYRILNDDSVYVQEFANKVHLKASIRSLLKMDFSLFTKEPFQQPDRDNNEGATRNSKVPFLNYHPSWIKEQLNKNKLNVRRKYGCSYLRVPTLKKLLGEDLMIKLEKLLQNTLFWSNISPSIFFETNIAKDISNTNFENLNDILVCPSCKGNLDISKGKAVCTKCEKEFSMVNDIWDFRI